MTIHEFQHKWWTLPEGDAQIGCYIMHLIHDCHMDWQEALALTINNFALNRPDPLDQLLEKSK